MQMQYYFLLLIRSYLSENVHIFDDSLFFNSNLISNEFLVDFTKHSWIEYFVYFSRPGILVERMRASRVPVGKTRAERGDWKERDEEEGYECERSQGGREREGRGGGGPSSSPRSHKSS